MFNLGMGEITVILLLALIFIGPKKLPDLASGLGKLIREIRKATSDVKNEISLDDSFRKPFEELRDAVTLHPDELKRRDQWRKDQEEATRRAVEEAARFNAEQAQAVGPVTSPDGLDSPVKIQGVSQPDLEALAKELAAPKAAPLPGPLPGPNDTIVQTAPPQGATLDDIPTPPPELAKPETVAVPKAVPDTKPAAATKPVAATKPAAAAEMRPPGPAPAGTVPRPDTLRGVKPAGTPVAASAPAVVDGGGEGNNPNATQILREEDLLPAFSSGKPPPPPHLPGLRPAAKPPFPPPSADKKKA